MNKLAIILLLMPFLAYSQGFKEVRSFHKDGSEKEVVYKNQELEIIKIDNFDDKKRKVSSYNIDPKTQKIHGVFFNTVNSGTYFQGELSCKDCILNFNDTQIKGEIKNGRPVGKIDTYSVKEKVKLQYNPTTSYILSLDQGQRINYSSYVGTGIYEIEYKNSLHYNEDGFLDGPQKINSLTTLFFDNGTLIGFNIKNAEATSVMKDSVHKSNNIWKVNNQYVKSNGMLKEINWNEFHEPWVFDYEIFIPENLSSFDWNPELITFATTNSEIILNELAYRTGWRSNFFKKSDSKKDDYCFKKVLVDYKNKTKVLDESNGIYMLSNNQQYQLLKYFTNLYHTIYPESDEKFPQYEDNEYSRFKLESQLLDLIEYSIKVDNSTIKEEPLFIDGTYGYELFLDKYTHGGDGPGHYVDFYEFLKFMHLIINDTNSPIENVYLVTLNASKDENGYISEINYIQNEIRIENYWVDHSISVKDWLNDKMKVLELS